MDDSFSGAEPGAPSPRQVRRRRLALAAGAAMLAIVIAGILAARLVPQRVTGVEVVRRDVARTLVLTGRVRPPARPRLGASIAGTVRQVLVREGDHVASGDLLVRLEDAPQEAALAGARAALATAAARSRSALEQAEIAVGQAESDLARARSLQARGAIPARELETAERAVADARARLEEARARAQGGSGLPAEVARARAAVAAAEAQLELTRVTAPAAGTVLARSVEPGDAVLPGQALLELSLDGPTELVAFPREENLPELRPGAPALASADAFPMDTFPARVAWISPAVDPAQGTVEVRLAVPDPPPYLRADMTVSINVEVARRAGALVIPRSVVRAAATVTPWVVVASDGRAVKRDVRLGIMGDREVEITAGLTEGERVLPAGVEPGARVWVEG